jgi:hypothetical protein
MEGSSDLFETFLFSWRQDIVPCGLGIEPGVSSLPAGRYVRPEIQETSHFSLLGAVPLEVASFGPQDKRTLRLYLDYRTLRCGHSGCKVWHLIIT